MRDQQQHKKLNSVQEVVHRKMNMPSIHSKYPHEEDGHLQPVDLAFTLILYTLRRV